MKDESWAVYAGYTCTSRWTRSNRFRYKCFVSVCCIRWSNIHNEIRSPLWVDLNFSLKNCWLYCSVDRVYDTTRRHFSQKRKSLTKNVSPTFYTSSCENTRTGSRCIFTRVLQMNWRMSPDEYVSKYDRVRTTFNYFESVLNSVNTCS